MANATCRFCMHPLDGRSKKFCTTCLPPYGEWNDKRSYTQRYNLLNAAVGDHPSYAATSRLPAGHPARPKPRYPRKGQPTAELICMDCGEQFKGRKAKRCPSCTVAHSWVGRRESLGPDWKPSDSWRKREALRRRNARRRTGDRPTVKRLAERDGWCCHLCGKRIRSELTGTGDKMRASIDHLVPISDGGLDTMANTKLAHLRCNAKRQDGGVVQLQLVG